MPRISALNWLHVSSLWVYRVVTWGVLACGFAFALVVFSVRYWVLPNVENYREVIAREVSAAARQRITIGRLEGYWSGLRPYLVLGDVEVLDKAGQPALKLERVESSLSWWSLVFVKLRFHSIQIDRPDLTVRRDSHGVISVAGIELTDPAGDGGFSDWLLHQDEIVVRDAGITWHDELRNAPPLELKSVHFRLENSGRYHRFGLRAVPPQPLASPLDLRGNLTGYTVRDLTQWNGQLFAELDFIDIAAWRTWLQFPVSFPQGAGALRIWAGLGNGGLNQITADVQLSQVKTRLGRDLRELDLTSLKGRVGWKLLADGFEVSASKLGFATDEGLTFQPADFLLNFKRGNERRPPQGELHANAIDIEPLVKLADHLPWDPELRSEVDRFGPRGSLYDVLVKWSGAWPDPSQYSAKARFVNLGLQAQGKLPGFAGVSGHIDGNEKGGKLYLNTQRAAVELPLVFRERLAFDVLFAQVGWAKVGDRYDITLNNVSFSSPDLAGSVFGEYHTVADGPGTIDLSGNLTRADGRNVGRYLPLRIGERGHNWLEAALLGGESNDVKLRLKGNLAEFPFPEGKGGVFQVAARVSGGVLDYTKGWPKIENISGQLAFRGPRMEILAREATILGVRLARVRAEIPNLNTPDRVLTVGGDAEGPTSEFLAFIAQSPVLNDIDNFTEGIQAQGRGKLALKLVIPLNNTRDTRVAGTYQFINNQLVEADDLPPLEQVNGRIEFTEASVRAPGVTMTFLGGPATLTAASGRDGVVRVNWQGRANMDNLRKAVDAPWLQALRGSADWKAAINLRKKLADVVFDSTLQGIASDLPPPLAKAAAESLPLKIERRYTGARQDRLAFSIGNIVSAQLQRRRDGDRTVIDRGSVSFGAAAAPLERNGIWVSGSIKSLDVDQWLAMLPAGIGATVMDLAGIDLKIESMDVFGRPFSEFALHGSQQGGSWQASIGGHELNGDLSWRPQGKGRLVARMKQLTIPAALPPKPTDKPVPDRYQASDFPALDVVAENFQLRDKTLGKLELNAVPDGRDWRIERLRISNPESTLLIDGLWQGFLAQPRTQVNVRLDVSNVGKLLVRLGQPEGVRGASARLEGLLAWSGGPHDIDYPSLSGNLVLEASKGQFVKLDPGIGKLLGVLSLQSLPRRITLDFRDIFSEGLAFDEIIGALKISRGVASAENFRIQGPAVRILMSGDVDINAETQKLRVKVLPSMSDSLSVAGALIGGPIAGIASFLVQKALKDPLDQIAAYEYSISGTWADPQVLKIDPHAPAAAEKPK